MQPSGEHFVHALEIQRCINQVIKPPSDAKPDQITQLRNDHLVISLKQIAQLLEHCEFVFELDRWESWAHYGGEEPTLSREIFADSRFLNGDTKQRVCGIEIYPEDFTSKVLWPKLRAGKRGRPGRLDTLACWFAFVKFWWGASFQVHQPEIIAGMKSAPKEHPDCKIRIENSKKCDGRRDGCSVRRCPMFNNRHADVQYWGAQSGGGISQLEPKYNQVGKVAFLTARYVDKELTSMDAYRVINFEQPSRRQGMDKLPPKIDRIGN